VTDVTPDVSSPDVSRRSRTPFVLAGVGLVVVAAVVAGIWFAHWRSSLRPFVSYPDNGFSANVRVGQTEYFGDNLTDKRVISNRSTAPDHLTIHVSSITPVIGDKDAEATVSVLRCVLAQDGDGPVGYDQADTDATCASLTPFRSGTLTLGDKKGDDNLVIAVTPHNAGREQIAGIEVRYSSGLRHGNQHTGLQMGTTTSR
jgi:hypothetical protein